MNLPINTGDVIRLQKDGNDSASYYIIDLVDLETVPAPLTQPTNSFSHHNLWRGQHRRGRFNRRLAKLHQYRRWQNRMDARPGLTR